MSDLIEIFVTETGEDVTLNITPNLVEVNIIKGIAPSNPITGSLTTNYLPKATGATTLGNSLIYDDGVGFIGFGTTTPIGNATNKVLKVEASSSANIVLTQTGGASGGLTSFGSELNLSTSTNHPLYFGTNGSERLRITSSGNVGIGTTSPSSKLHSYSTASYVETQGISSQSDSNIITLGAGSSGSTAFEPNYMGVNESGLLSSKSMRFSIYSAGGSYFKWSNNGSEQMRITSSGNVGIGTTSPQTALDVNGLIKAGQYTNATEPAYVKGALYFNTTLNKYKIGGTSAWETVTSI